MEKLNYLYQNAQTYFYNKQYDKALETASLMEKGADRFLYAVVYIAEYYLYYGLAIAVKHDSLPPGSRKR